MTEEREWLSKLGYTVAQQIAYSCEQGAERFNRDRTEGIVAEFELHDAPYVSLYECSDGSGLYVTSMSSLEFQPVSKEHMRDAKIEYGLGAE
jgi:hypothetical protein